MASTILLACMTHLLLCHGFCIPPGILLPFLLALRIDLLACLQTFFV